MSEWISSRDRLPEISGNYLVFIQDPFVKDCSNPFEDCSYILTASYTTDDGLWRESEDSYYCANLDCVNTDMVYYISHWRPMPKGPYEPKTNGDLVRSKTNEELLDWFWWMLKYVQGYTDSVVALKDWLDKEAQNNG